MPFGFKFVKESAITQLKEEMTRYQRELEDIGWINFGTDQFNQNQIFSIPFKQILKTCKVYYYKNPLAGHWVNLTTNFVFGEGISKPKAKEPKIQEVLDLFWDDKDNQKSLTSYMAQQLLSNKIQYEGNLFFVLFTDELGNVKVRILNTEEVDDVIYDPEDRMRPIFYKVQNVERKFSFLTNSYNIIPKGFIYYADVENHNPDIYNIPEDKLKKDCRILHIKINCDINDRFGVPELYRGIDWIKAHKTMAEDLATLVKALSNFAWKKKIKGTASQVASISASLQSKMNLSNIKNSAGQMQIENDSVDLQTIDIKTGGVKVATDGLKEMQLMVCSASGIFHHYFGDPSTGNLATAKSMELPMVKKFANWQSLWSDIYTGIFNYLIDRKIEAGQLDGYDEEDSKTNRIKIITKLDRQIDIDFPPILEEDLNQWSQALNVAKQAGLVGEELAAQLFMLAANVNNIDEEMKKLLAENEAKKQEQAEMFDKGLDKDGKPINGNNFEKKPEEKDQKKSGSEQVKEKDLKEAIELPMKRIKDRGLKKENYVLSKMNGYRKVINSNFKKFINEVKENAKVSPHEGKFVGHVQGFYESLNRFTDSMQESAKVYYPIAIDIGEKFMKANLKDLKPDFKAEESLYEANGSAKNILQKRLLWNQTYIAEKLEPSMIESFEKVVRTSYPTEQAFMLAIAEAMLKYESRIEQYVGAFWTVEEEAVKEAGKGTGVKVNFIGPDDNHTCEGCEEAVKGSPWNIDEAPIPGEQECLGRCRHALQIVE